MSSVKLKVFKGKQIPFQTLSRIQGIWREVFNDPNSLWKSNKELLPRDTFFVVYGNRKIVSIGRLREATVEFLNREYTIQGIADIASLVKNKGHGAIIIKNMHKHLSKSNQIGIGFCEPKVSDFYRKHGFEVTSKLKKRFVYKNKNKRISTNKNNVIYFDPHKKLINKIFKYSKGKIHLEIPHW